ncbi:MAG TPA: hypothetical protein VHF47_01650 [Acidimicrobiales bacterium]|nr:hypothetical protein [Acidimicrobiales bacterium]
MVARVVESPAEVPLPLPPGLTVVPVQDPDDFARALAARTGAVLVGSAEEAEQELHRRLVPVTPHSRAAEEVAWLRAVAEGGAVDLPPRLAPDPELRSLAERLTQARRTAKETRVALLKREAAVQAEARRAPGALAEVEPELARRVAHRVAVALRRARAAKRALGPKPVLDREIEQQARRAMSRLEDALFAHSRARGRVHTRLAVGNVVGLLLALIGAVVVWSGADLDAPSVYAVFALSGAAPLAALAIGTVGAVHAKRRVHAASVGCAKAFARAGVRDADELAGRRAELEDWLARADATAAARDAWHEAVQAWQAMAGPEADPRDVEELLEAGARLREAGGAAAAARAAAEEAGRALVAVEQEVQDRLATLPAATTGTVVHDDSPIIVLAGSGHDQARLAEWAPAVPVALVTTIDAAAHQPEPEPEPEPVPVVIDVRETDPEPAAFGVDVRKPEPEPVAVGVDVQQPEADESGARTFVFDAQAVRRLRRRARRFR